MIPHSRPFIDKSDIDAVTSVMESGMLAHGTAVTAFERDLADYTGLGSAVALSSGTAALYAVLAAMGAGSGNSIVIPSYVCSSLVYAVRMTGAEPVVADTGADDRHMDADSVRRVLTSGVKAVVFPHMFGSANDISGIVALGVPVIEDCALSLGASLNGIMTGNLGSAAAVFSFYATKVIASGEGGMAASHDARLIERIRDIAHYADKPDDVMRFNFAMSDMAAALGCSQLRKLDLMIERRRELAALYTERLRGTTLSLPSERTGERGIFYRYVVRTAHVEALREGLRKRGVAAERPVHTPLSQYPGINAVCPRAEEAWRTSLSLPLYPVLTDTEADTVIDTAVEAASELD